MKKIIFTVSIFVLLCSSVLAQENISNKFYFRYSISNPTNSYYNYGNWGLDSTYKKGGAIEFGSLFYFKGLNLGPKAKLGMDITYLSATKHMMGFDLGMNIDIEDGGFSFSMFYPQTTFYNIGSKLGPVFTYNVWDKLNIDLFAKVNPIWLNAAIRDYQNDEPLTYYKGLMGLKYSFGMNVRYDFIMLGAELNLGKLKYQSLDDKDLYIGNSLFSIDPETFEIIPPKFKETNSACLNLSVGFCF